MKEILEKFGGHGFPYYSRVYDEAFRQAVSDMEPLDLPRHWMMYPFPLTLKVWKIRKKIKVKQLLENQYIYTIWKMNPQFLPAWAALSTLLISYGMGHGLVNIALVQYWFFIDPQLDKAIWGLPVFLFLLGQLVLVSSCFVRQVKGHRLLFAAGTVTIALGILTLISVGEGAITVTVITTIPFGLLVAGKIKKMMSDL